ncbi:hypothetical protein CE91St56_39130 [Lachnospiraceae bacterium]|nr:hypothetical protein CE91St56_39130 [Lachnospiraceae bacterium]
MDFAHNCEDTEQLTMLNINLGKTRELLEKCRTLREYCMFVERIGDTPKSWRLRRPWSGR